MPMEIDQTDALTRLPPASCSAFSLRGETGWCLEITHNQ